MVKILAILLVLVETTVSGQIVQIDTLRLQESERFVEIQSDKMNFPIIRTESKRIDSLINFDLKNRFTSNEYPNESIDSTLIKWAGDQIIYMEFEVTYNKDGMLSLNISAEGCGAYCSSWTDYFNYSTISGEALDISEIIDITGEFGTRIHTDKETLYDQQKQELREMLNDKESGLDSMTYKWALEYYHDCESSVDLKSFAIYPDRLEIIEFCYLPNAIKNLTPTISLKYDNSEIGKYLKIKN